MVPLVLARRGPLPLGELYAEFRSRFPHLVNDNLVSRHGPSDTKWRHMLRSALERLKRDGVVRRGPRGWELYRR